MEISKIIGNIVHVKTHTRFELTSMFCRFQEYYESPEFKGKIFTLGQFREWYSKQKGAWTYHGDWSGFNIPSYVLEPFIQGLFDPLSHPEQDLVELFRGRTDKFYIIGTSEESESDTLDHEIMHGLFYSNDDYKKFVTNLLISRDKELEAVYDFLKTKGYHDSVWLDEAHAYLGASTKTLDENGVSYPKDLAAMLQNHYRLVKEEMK